MYIYIYIYIYTGLLSSNLKFANEGGQYSNPNMEWIYGYMDTPWDIPVDRFIYCVFVCREYV